MLNHEIFAVSLARSLELAATGAARSEQKEALRAVHALTSVASAMVRVYQGLLSVDDVGIPDSLPFVAGLIARMEAHGVAEVAIAMGATPAELLALVRGLAAEPAAEGGAQRIKMRLRDVHSTDIMVIPLHAAGSGERRPPTVTQAFEASAVAPLVSEDAAAAAPAGPSPAPRAPLETAAAFPGFDRAFDLVPEPSTAPAGAEREAGAAPPAPVEALQPQVMSAATPLAAALERVARDPYGPGILDRLSELSRQIQDALAADAIQPALHAIVAMTAWEPGAPDGSPRNSYAIVLRRTLSPDTLARVAPYVADPRLATEAVKVLQRGRVDGVEVLLGLLAAADGIRERKAYMTALRDMPEGVTQVVHMLEHQQWFVVRNVADLMGDLRIEEAVPGLSRCLDHADNRVRRAAAVALAKIGSTATVEPLRRVLKEGDRDLRALIAGSVGGPTSRPLAMPLAAFAEQEEDPGVVREFYHALGRIGTPDALQALAKAAQPGGRLLSRRPAGPRVAAIEGLRLAGSGAARAILQTLATDGDRTVREAAAAAAAEIGARPAAGAG